jgi:ABC-type multidrug transport system ATPase subunit
MALAATVSASSTPVGFSVPSIEVDGLWRRFAAVDALRDVSLAVEAGEIHALLGRNGAGKTTLMRILGGLAEPTAGSAYVLDQRVGRSRALRGAIGLVPSGDRSFYLRISGLENLVFFARLHGMRRAAARARAADLLAAVGLSEVARRAVNTYSHGMQKRLSFARALLTEPRVLLVDEATHDLDPVAARQVRDLTVALAGSGTAVLWATQRVEELSGFADSVTVLDRGEVRFSGSLAGLTAVARAERHVLRLGPGSVACPQLDRALGAVGSLEPAPDGDPRHVVLTLAEGAALGAAIAALVEAGAEIDSCREDGSPIERAFLALTGGSAA